MQQKPLHKCCPVLKVKSAARPTLSACICVKWVPSSFTREGEIDIAKRIEDGINQVQCSVAEYPEAITYLLEQYDRVEAGESRLSDLITGFVDPNAEEDLAPTATHVGSELPQAELDKDDDEDEEDEDADDSDDDNSIDPELARQKFSDLREQYEKRVNILNNMVVVMRKRLPLLSSFPKYLKSSV